MCEVYSDSLRFWERYYLAFHRLRQEIRRQDGEFGVILAGIVLPLIFHLVILVRLGNAFEPLVPMLKTSLMLVGLAWWVGGIVASIIFFILDLIERDFYLVNALYKVVHIFIHATLCAFYLVMTIVVPYLPFLWI